LYAEAIQAEGVVSTVKHFTLNAQETGRMMAESRIEEAAHREPDLVAFQSAIEDGQPGSVMPGYNLINGHSRGGTRSDRNADDFGPRLAFGRVHLQSGESHAVELHLSPRLLARWDVDAGAFSIVGGDYESAPAHTPSTRTAPRPPSTLRPHSCVDSPARRTSSTQAHLTRKDKS
jgi:Fibronectin type III-like domain/Glycosyl hydrolase family 3 N terminal domain